MATYRYEAVNFTGDVITGEMEAGNSTAVTEHLHRLGYLPLLADKKTESWLAQLHKLELFGKDRLSMRDIALMTQELAVMLRAGLSLEKSLDMLAGLADKPETTAFLKGVTTRVRNGAGFADALAAQETSLPKAYIGMVRAGETGGGKMLEATLERLAEYLNKEQRLRDTVASALLYPAILLVIAALSIIIMLMYVLPQFEPIFQSAGAALPSSTRMVMAIGHGLRDYGFFILVLMVFGGVMLKRTLQREDVALKRDAFVLRMPRIGPIVIKTETAKFCRTLGALQSNGVPLATALPIAAESFSNKVFLLFIQRIAVQVREGESLAKLLSREKMFPPLAMQMVRIGEDTGHLDAMLLRVADIFDRDVQRSVERLMTLLAPALTIVLGAIIAGIIAAVLSAVLSVNDLVM